jgi:hypothetical protein
MRKRQTALTVAALILIAGVVAGRERSAAEMMLEAAAPAVAAPRDDGIDLSRLQREPGATPRIDPFGRPAVPERKEVAQSKPEAPPLPFQYFGRLVENGKTEVFVINGEEVHAVEPGKSIGDYRVDKVTERGIAFTYLPMKAKQTLEIQ